MYHHLKSTINLFITVSVLNSNFVVLGGSSDGEKFICLDYLKQDIANKQCLVYSFGIGDDWTFEESMVELGCVVNLFNAIL